MDLHISLVGRENLSGEIYRQLRQAILDGRLRAGELLSPTRLMARRLGVSRTTVTVAYDRLAGEGFITSHVGSGTFVNELPVRVTNSSVTSVKRGVLTPRDIWRDVPLPEDSEGSAIYDFRCGGNPDASFFPHDVWNRLMTRELRAANASGAYAHPAGHRGLREAIARRLAVARGVDCTADDITITNGTQQALDVLARALVAPGERVAVEDPGYRPTRFLLQSLGARVAGVPVDDQGLVVSAIPKGTRFLYVTPSHQYPLGVTMSLPRRLELLRWAERNGAAIVEDDYDTEFRFGGRPIEPLYALDTAGRVVYVGSFSKTMLPTLRLGFAVTPPSIRAAVHRAKFVADWHTAMPAQAALARFMDDGVFGRHIRKLSAVYEKRHELVTRILAMEFAGVLEAVPSSAGLHIAALAPGFSSARMTRVSSLASERGVGVYPLSRFAIGRPRVGLLIAYGAIPTAQIAPGLRRLRECFE